MSAAWREQARPLLEAGTISNTEIGRRVGAHESRVRAYRKELGLPPSTAKANVKPEPTLPALAPSEIELNESGESLDRARMNYHQGQGEGEFEDVISSKPLKSWSHVFEFFELDPDEFEIVDDTIRASVWQQSKALEDGTRTTVKLRSYRARFRKVKTEESFELPALYAAARSESVRINSPRTDRTTVVVWADPQIGKVASRGGTEELIERSRAKRSLLAAELERRAPKACALLDGGDGIEGFESGGNPMFTNDLSLTRQLDLYGTELMEWIKVLLPHGRVDVLGVPSNHAAWRNGKQNLGNPGDDLGLFMHRQVRRVSEAAGLSVSFHQSTEYDESAAIDIDGTTVGLVHGNQFGPGQAVAWWEKQTFGSQAVASADVLVTAHYHSFGAGVAGRNPTSGRQRWWLGAPTLDNGSDWYRNTAGRDSDPGVMVFDITPDGFDLASLAIL